LSLDSEVGRLSAKDKNDHGKCLDCALVQSTREASKAPVQNARRQAPKTEHARVCFPIDPLESFAEIAGMGLIRIDSETKLHEFRRLLQWEELSHLR
jgi:L-arabinose isomerase